MTRNKNKPIFVIAIVAILVVMCLILVFRFNSDDTFKFDLSEKFEVTADITCSDLKAKAKIKREGVQNYHIELLEPQTLKGLEAKFAGEDIDISYMGATLNLKSGGVLPYNTLNLVVKTIDKVLLTEQEPTKNGDGWTFEGKIDNYTYQFGVKDGKFAYLNLPQLDFTMQIQ